MHSREQNKVIIYKLKLAWPLVRFRMMSGLKWTPRSLPSWTATRKTPGVTGEANSSSSSRVLATRSASAMSGASRICATRTAEVRGPSNNEDIGEREGKLSNLC